MNFIRKVYGILSIQLCITATFVAMVKLNERWNEFVKTADLLTLFATITACILMICLLCFRNLSRKVPINYILLFCFTVCQTFLVARVCSFYEASLILTMAILTGAMTLVITIFACFAESDFTTTHAICPIITVCIVSMIICSFFMIFSSWWHPIYAAICVILYGLYLVHDTQLIAGNKTYALSYDDYIIGAMMVYVDIVTIFIQMLSLFGEKN